MKMKTLLSAAHAAGYAMAPSAEQFHAAEEKASRVFATPDVAIREAARRASVPALPAPHKVDLAQSWLKGVLGTVLTRRATA